MYVPTTTNNACKNVRKAFSNFPPLFRCGELLGKNTTIPSVREREQRVFSLRCGEKGDKLRFGTGERD